MPIKTSPLPIVKLSATGNDFLLVDLLDAQSARHWKAFAKKSRAHWAKTWCDRHEGLGADGLVWIEKDKNVDFKWDFFNSDGSAAEMCGNAARAVSLYASLRLKKKKLKFQSRIGVVEATVASEKRIEIALPPIAEGHWNQVLRWKGSDLNYDFVRAGVPHAVVRVPNLDDRAGLRDFALEIKRQPSFLKDGTNVTFVRMTAKDRVESLTFERGVEDFTLSCGTGAVASAHSVLRGEEDQPVQVRVPGGTLSVVWKKGRPFLSGPARIVAEMHLSSSR
ncbi:MAG TPA: diaminopimelate epimerase [Bdellovibrionales bacterium]|nr:diaminopimelate epimerase [Bdellovibrionales bacterium]